MNVRDMACFVLKIVWTYPALHREESAENILAIKTKARTVEGREDKSLLGDPGSKLLLEREK